MKHLLLTTIAAVVLVGCGESQQSASAPKTKPEPPTAKAADISIRQAAYDGNIEAVKQAITDGADVNAKNRMGWTPLHQVATKEIAELLIAKSADVNAKDTYNRTPLHRAVEGGRKETAELLIAEGADVNAKDDYGTTPLHQVTTKEIAQLLIAKDADVNAKDDGGMAPLDFAITTYNLSISDFLIKHGGVTGKKPDISIHEAVASRDVLAINYHLIAGTDVNAKDDEGKTPMDLAKVDDVFDSSEAKAEKRKMADLLRKHGGKFSSIHSAAMSGDIQAVKEFLSAGTDVNAKTEFGGTPLHYAVSKEIIELLIANGADVNAKGLDDYTLLHYAARSGDVETAELLISNGADVNVKVGTGFIDTPLDVAEYNGQKEIADLLRKHGGKSGHELKAEESIHIAAQYGNLELVKKHLAAGANVNEEDVMGMSPLHAACAGGNKEIVTLLVEKGADTNTKVTLGRPDEMTPQQKLGYGYLIGMTPLHMAATKEIAEVLIAKGADLNVRVTSGPHKGKTPLNGFEDSNEGKNSETADLLRKHGGKTGEELKAEGK